MTETRGRPRKHSPSGATGGRKVCSDCGESKPSSDFYKRARSPDGLQASCAACLLAKIRQHRENGRNGISDSIIVHVLKKNFVDDGILALDNHRAYRKHKVEPKRCPECGGKMRYRSVLKTCEACHVKAKGEEHDG